MRLCLLLVKKYPYNLILGIVFLLAFFAQIIVFYHNFLILLPQLLIPVADKLFLLLQVPYDFATTFWQQFVFTFFFSILLGLNIAGIMYYIRLFKASGASALALLTSGSFAGILAIACLSCGSVIIALFATALGVSSSFLAFSYQGTFFSFLSILMLLFSLALISKKIAKPFS